MKKLFIFLGFIVLCLVFASAASATGPGTPAYTPAVSTDNSAIDGHKMVYSKKSTSTNWDIYVTDLTTGNAKAVSTSSRYETSPDISGNYVVWEKYGSSGKQIWWKDISKTNPAAIIHASPGKDQLYPRISGSYVVWQQFIGEGSASNGNLPNFDIVGYNLATHIYYPNIASTNLYQGHPDISGKTVVYDQYTNLGTTASPYWKWQVYKTTFGTSNKGTKIYASSIGQSNPVVSRTGRAAWQEYFSDSRKFDIVWVDNVWSPTARNYEISSNNDKNPAIYANMLVWLQESSSGSNTYDICMKNLGTTGIALTKTPVIATGYDRLYPAIGGDSKGIFVSYTDNKDGYNRVYYRNMAKPPTAIAGSPARNAVNVARDQTITTTFNEPIKLGTMHFELYEAATKTKVEILSWINGNNFSILHALLKAATKYTLTLYQGSLTDLIGNPIAIYSRSFTTTST